VPFQDDIYGWVDSGWYCGPDNTYGDDFFEKLGKQQFRFNVLYEARDAKALSISAKAAGSSLRKSSEARRG
jgi:hypothetical protein